jgi:hypothetical protein
MAIQLNVKNSKLFAKLVIKPEENKMLARFKTAPDVRYKYENVPADVLFDLQKAESRGGYFIVNIRNNYSGVPY